MALPFHVLLGLTESMSFAEVGIPVWTWALTGSAGLIGLLATVLPLRAGARHLRAMEF
jgi:hypothetical protein